MKKLIVVILILGLGLAGYKLWQNYGQNGSAPTFRTQVVQKGQLRVAVGATGTINPVMVVNVGTQISGTIKEIYVDFNDSVTEGQLMLVLDDQLFKAKVDMSKANLSNAEAQLKLARLKFERQEKLYQAKTSTKEEYDTAQANLEMAKATVAQHEASLEQDMYNLNNTRITSPVNGVVINRGVDVGQTVAASFQTPTLINIAGDLTKMQINASFAEADIGRLVPGLSAVFSVDAYPGQSFNGTLRQIRLNPTITSNVVTYDVVIDVENPDQKLLPGMTAYVDIELHREDDVLLVPNTALNFRPTGYSLPDSPSAAMAAGNSQINGGSGPASSGAGPPPPMDGGMGGPPPGGGPPPPMEGGAGPGQQAPGNGAGSGSSSPAGASAQAGDDSVSHGRVFKQGPDGMPRAVELTLGTTDLRFTVVKSGDLKPGDEVLIGENLPEADRTLLSGAGMGGRRR
ncbi:MAG: efflux RND transporter periplasmic adaptor subunit [Deltaproteobacteria bacterium]|jgi:HlyD family secretion protein|nr:efflux RND transporter periplasmic adaptor subunit [Deltaproteobacteria bacterium]